MAHRGQAGLQHQSPRPSGPAGLRTQGCCRSPAQAARQPLTAPVCAADADVQGEAHIWRQRVGLREEERHLPTWAGGYRVHSMSGGWLWHPVVTCWPGGWSWLGASQAGMARHWQHVRTRISAPREKEGRGQPRRTSLSSCQSGHTVLVVSRTCGEGSEVNGQARLTLLHFSLLHSSADGRGCAGVPRRTTQAC